MKSKIKTKHRMNGFSKWIELTKDCMYEKPRIKGFWKRRYRKIMRLKIKGGDYG